MQWAEKIKTIDPTISSLILFSCSQPTIKKTEAKSHSEMIKLILIPSPFFQASLSGWKRVCEAWNLNEMEKRGGWRCWIFLVFFPLDRVVASYRSVHPPYYYYLYPSVHRLRFCRVCACAVWGSWENGTLLSGQMTASFTFRIYTFRRRKEEGGEGRKGTIMLGGELTQGPGIFSSNPRKVYKTVVFGVFHRSKSVSSSFLSFFFSFSFSPLWWYKEKPRKGEGNTHHLN